jgi:predicted regulator of amino acid metabolism with ACT domain
MGKPYSDDLLERVGAAIEAGHTGARVAEALQHGLSTVGTFVAEQPHSILAEVQARLAKEKVKVSQDFPVPPSHQSDL